MNAAEQRATLVVMATMPGRPVGAALASLRPQVDRLYVVCNGMSEPPGVVRELADAWDCDPENIGGSHAKFRESRTWKGHYFCCDDDLEYPPDYIAAMSHWIAQWNGRALVTAHGRTLAPDARAWHEILFAARCLGRVREGRWINYPGCGVLAFDTRLGVPATWAGRNTDDALLARWAQQRRVPIRLVPHDVGWLQSLTLDKQAETIFRTESENGFRDRNAVIASHSPWTVFDGSRSRET